MTADHPSVWDALAEDLKKDPDAVMESRRRGCEWVAGRNIHFSRDLAAHNPRVGCPLL
jgi:hypothetical protein